MRTELSARAGLRACAPHAAIAFALSVAGCAGAGVTPETGGAVRTTGGTVRALGYPTYDGCPVFTSTDKYYNKDVSGVPLDPNSSKYIASLGQNNSWDFDSGEYLNTATNQTPVLPVKQDVPWHVEPPEPWLPSYLIEQGGDAHSFVLNVSSCKIFELYDTKYSQGTLSAYSGGHWNLKKNFVPYPPGQSSADASGDSMFAGAVKYTEAANGEIDHALFLIAPYNMLSQWSFVRPASSTDAIQYEGPGPMPMPYGAKLRLRADYPESGMGTQTLAVIHALKTYGAIVSDTGCCYKLIFMNDLSTPNNFDWRDLNKIRSIKTTDWGVVKLGRILQVPH